MKIQVNTDRHIEGDESLIANVQALVEAELERFSDRISRVEVHLSDQNAGKGGADDKKCVMEARIEGRNPIAVTHEASTAHNAAEGASGKLMRAVANVLDRIDNR